MKLIDPEYNEAICFVNHYISGRKFRSGGKISKLYRQIFQIKRTDVHKIADAEKKRKKTIRDRCTNASETCGE